MMITLFLPGTGYQKPLLSLRLFIGLRTKWPLIGTFCYMLALRCRWFVICQFTDAVYTAMLLKEATPCYVLRVRRAGCDLRRRFTQNSSDHVQAFRSLFIGSSTASQKRLPNADKVMRDKLPSVSTPQGSVPDRTYFLVQHLLLSLLEQWFLEWLTRRFTRWRHQNNNTRLLLRLLREGFGCTTVILFVRLLHEVTTSRCSRRCCLCSRVRPDSVRLLRSFVQLQPRGYCEAMYSSGYDLYSCNREVIAKLCTVAIVRLLRRFVQVATARLLRRFVQLQPRGYRNASYSCNCVVIAFALFQALHACGYVERLLR